MIGVYGKVASQPDFLRANAGEFSQAGLDLWFQEAVEALRGESATLPQGPTAFLLAPDAAPAAFVGAFAPSTDAAGRSFPLVVFAQIPRGDLAERFPTVPSEHAAFVQAAGAVVAEGASGLDGGAVVARAQALAMSAGAPLVSDANLGLGDESAQPLVAALGGASAALGYALRTFTAACDQAAKTGPAGRAGVITVDAPAPTDAVRRLWLELARRRLRWREGAPSLLWTEGAAGRLLMTLGQPAPGALSYLANPRHRASRFWPLRTDVTAAIDQAMKALTPEQKRRVENPRVSLGELVSSFGVLSAPA
ncbi:MAG: type VI secretion system-associated protein TagF [Pseudomonadota bacterium]